MYIGNYISSIVMIRKSANLQQPQVLLEKTAEHQQELQVGSGRCWSGALVACL